jgi:hypothetical protein
MSLGADLLENPAEPSGGAPIFDLAARLFRDRRV